MGRLTPSWWALAEGSPLTTGDPLADLTSYGIFSVLVVIAWRLFRWWRDDQRAVTVAHDDEVSRLRHDKAALMAHITELSVIIARLGGDVPSPPELEE